MPPIFDSLITPALKSVTDLISQFHLSPEEKLQAQQAVADAQAKAQDAARQYEVDLAKLANDDRASARTRQSLVKDITPSLLAAGVTLGFFGLLAYVAKNEIPPASKDIIVGMIGSLGTAWVGIISYYFGSSSGSDKKTEILAQVITPASGGK